MNINEYVQKLFKRATKPVRHPDRGGALAFDERRAAGSVSVQWSGQQYPGHTQRRSARFDLNFYRRVRRAPGDRARRGRGTELDTTVSGRDRSPDHGWVDHLHHRRHRVRSGDQGSVVGIGRR